LLQQLRHIPRLNQWITSLEALDAQEPHLDLPEGMSLVELLMDLAVPLDDINPVLAQRPVPGREEWWLVERAARLLLPHIGSPPGELPPFPRLTDGSNPFLRYFYLYVFAMLHPHIQAWHRAKRISDDISRRTLADLGRQMALNQRRLGYGGLNLNMDWLQYHITGKLFQLGRLQFERGRLGKTTGHEVAAGGLPLGPGDLALGVHIPDFSGPFDPDACDASFAMAARFFPDHFPEETFQVVTCHSWLMDRALADYLSPASNILAFQKRFTINHRDRPPQEDMVFDFVFGVPASAVNRVPQHSSLQRAIVRHIRNGHHWYGGVGWCPFPGQDQR